MVTVAPLPHGLFVCHVLCNVVPTRVHGISVGCVFGCGAGSDHSVRHCIYCRQAPPAADWLPRGLPRWTLARGLGGAQVREVVLRLTPYRAIATAANATRKLPDSRTPGERRAYVALRNSGATQAALCSPNVFRMSTVCIVEQVWGRCGRVGVSGGIAICPLHEKWPIRR